MRLVQYVRTRGLGGHCARKPCKGVLAQIVSSGHSPLHQSGMRLLGALINFKEAPKTSLKWKTRKVVQKRRFELLLHRRPDAVGSH